MQEVKRTERGWAGHFICANYCRFRRNTLLEYGDKKWVVSTVGYYVNPFLGKMEEIGHHRWYETMAFKSDAEDTYFHDADVTQEIPFESEWGIFADTAKELIDKHPFADNEANDMHEAVVAELMEKIKETRQ